MRPALMLISLLLLLALPAVAAHENEIVVVGAGETKTIRFTDGGLLRVSVRNTRIAVVREVEADQVVLAGMQPGETWVEVLQGEHRWTLVKVRVAAGQPRKAEDLHQIAGAGAAPSDAPPARPAYRMPDAAPGLQVSVEPVFGLDTGRFPLFTQAGASAGSITLRHTFQVFPFSLRRRSGTNNTLTLDLPYIRRSQKVTVGNAASTSIHDEGVGDVEVGFERNFPRFLDRATLHGTFDMSVRLPTGKSVYDIGENELPMGGGHYEIGARFGVRTITDPLLATASAGLSYALARQVGERRVKPGLGYSVQTGIGYVLSDQWLLSEQIAFSRRTNVNLLGAGDTLSQRTDEAYLTHNLIYNPTRGGNVFRLSFTAGLNDASTDYIVGLTTQWTR